MSKLSKEFKKIKRENELQSRIINKIKNDHVLKKYIEDDELISYIIGALEYNRFKMHRTTFKNFITTKYKCKISDETKPHELDDLKPHELEALAINLNRFNSVTSSTIDSKLNELKYLKLIEFETDNNHILGTDLLCTILSGKYKRASKSTKNEKQFIMETEDKLFAYRHQTSDKQYLEEKKDFIEKIDIYNNIYVIDRNQFIIGRRETESEEGLYNRIKKLLKSKLIDQKAYKIDSKTNHLNLESKILPGETESIGIEEETENIEVKIDSKQITIKIYLNNKMRFNEKNYEEIFNTLPNHIEFIRY